MWKNNRKRLTAYLSMVLILLSLLHSRGRNVNFEEYNAEQETSEIDYLYKESNTLYVG